MASNEDRRAPVRCAQGLALDAGPEEAACAWNVVAYEGEFAGHSAGAFTFSRETFEQLVANFRKDPRFKARATMPPVEQATAEQLASGAYDVVQWDFHHASEMPPTSGNIAAEGAPAQGWVLDLKIGDYEGKCALLALSRFLEPARSYIRAKRYRWCSVSVWFGAPDPVTGKDQGAVLTSIAVTNNPFLQGLPALRAARDGRLADRYWFGPACDKEQAFGNIRSLFGMPETASLADVTARLALVTAWATAGGARPPDIDEESDASDVLGALRQILALPLLTPAAEVLAQASSLLASLAPPSAATSAQLQAGGAGPQKENLMSQNASGAQSAKGEAGALLIAGGPDLRTTMARIVAKQRNCAIDDVGDHHILAAIENAAGLQAKIDELMGAIGAKTLAEALAKMSAAEELKSKLAEALAGKAAAEEAMSGMEEEMVEEDVGLALASLGITDASKADKVKRALLAERGKTAESIVAFRKTYDLDALRKAAREKLTQAAAQVIADRSSSAPAHLSASIATVRQTPAAVPQVEALSATMGADGSIRLSAPRSQEPGPGAGKGLTMASLRQSYPSEPNDFARKVAFVKAEHARNNPSAPALDHDTACERAHAMRLVA